MTDKPTTDPSPRHRTRRRKLWEAVADRPVLGSQRQYKQTVQKVDLWSVLRISTALNLFALVVLLSAGIVLWIVLRVLGVIDGIEDFIGDLISSSDFSFLDLKLLAGFTLVGIVISGINVTIVMIGATAYNLFAELWGGVEVTITEEEVSRPV